MRTFQPALTKDEAVARIYGVVGARPRGTRGEKGALDAVAIALDLDIDVAATTARAARLVAGALTLPWEERFEQRNVVNLAGLNALLRTLEQGGTAPHPRRVANPDTDLSLSFDPTFSPARGKLEAVNRLSALAHKGPEELGPGGKERKRVLVNLAARFAPELDPKARKSVLAAQIAAQLGAPWDRACASTGETISLRGLNALLVGVEKFLKASGVNEIVTAQAEGTALVSALFQELTTSHLLRNRVWDGRASARWMRDQGLKTEMNQSEWQGFLFEAVGRSAFAREFSRLEEPIRTRYGRTTFDYGHNFVWDLKVHTEAWVDESGAFVEMGLRDTILNDRAAIESCADEQGVGFLVLSGNGQIDRNDEFKMWHRDFKRQNGVRPRESNSNRSRRMKAAFAPLRIDAFFFPDRDALEHASAEHLVSGFSQGRQARNRAQVAGAVRKAKLKARLDRLRASRFHVAEAVWPR